MMSRAQPCVHVVRAVGRLRASIQWAGHTWWGSHASPILCRLRLLPRGGHHLVRRDLEPFRVARLRPQSVLCPVMHACSLGWDLSPCSRSCSVCSVLSSMHARRGGAFRPSAAHPKLQCVVCPVPYACGGLLCSSPCIALLGLLISFRRPTVPYLWRRSCSPSCGGDYPPAMLPACFKTSRGKGCAAPAKLGPLAGLPLYVPLCLCVPVHVLVLVL